MMSGEVPSISASLQGKNKPLISECLDPNKKKKYAAFPPTIRAKLAWSLRAIKDHGHLRIAIHCITSF